MSRRRLLRFRPQSGQLREKDQILVEGKRGGGSRGIFLERL